ncbi:hypothetical protein KAR91_04800 [Candidatus Pacearchaeota archaeon]|nr:hypothetical protein [Candidatus Pacearchaeota archaeon]
MAIELETYRLSGSKYPSKPVQLVRHSRRFVNVKQQVRFLSLALSVFCIKVVLLASNQLGGFDSRSTLYGSVTE